MKRWFVVAFAMLGFACGVHAQVAPQVVDTTVCDVVKKPAPFDGKMVRIKGTVIAGFDQFAIKDATDPNCGYPVNTIWLQYPQGTKGKAGAAAIVELQPAKNFAGQYTAPTRTAVTLDKSKDFKQFDSLLSQVHQKNTTMCLGCARYEVTATLIGRLDTVADATLKRDASGKIVGIGGFGNMNAYPARLVLQSVSDVTPKEIDYSKADAETKADAMQPPGGGGDLGGATAAMQKLAASLGAGPLKDLAVKAVGVYGKPGQQNGVTIGFGKTNELSPKDEGAGTQDSPDGVLFNCTLNEDRLQGDALNRAIVHLGTHISELQDPEKGNEDVPAFILESDAWVVTTVTALSVGQKYLTLPGGYVVWDTTWTAEQRNDKMESVLKDFLSNEMLLSR
ncbi:MAG: hypothetical protein WBA18_04405 [Terracidiphilus sp.]